MTLPARNEGCSCSCSRKFSSAITLFRFTAVLLRTKPLAIIRIHIRMYMCDVRGNHLAYNSKFCSMVCVSRRSQFCNGLAQFGPDSKNTGCLKKSSTRNILWDLLNQNRAVPAAAEETNNVCHQFLDQLCFTFMMFVRICARNVHVLT